MLTAGADPDYKQMTVVALIAAIPDDPDCPVAAQVQIFMFMPYIDIFIVMDIYIYICVCVYKMIYSVNSGIRLVQH